MSLNTTGQAKTEDYNLGRGTVYVAELTSGLPGDAGWRDLGNCPEFNISVDVETLKHESSRAGLRITDKEVVTKQEINVSFTLDELNFQNLALFFSGTASAAALTNPAVAGITERTFVTSCPDYAAVGGRWYDIESAAGVRAYDISAANLTLNSDTGGADNTLVEGTDYTVDEKMGRVFILSTATLVDAGDDLTYTLAADAGAVAPDEVKALTQTNARVALKFISENPANGDKQTEYDFHQIQLKPDGEFPLVGDEWTTVGFTGTAETNTTRDPDSPTLTIRTHANA